MKRLMILVALAVMLGGEAKAGFVVAGWNFESLADIGIVKTISLAAEYGTQQSTATITGTDFGTRNSTYVFNTFDHRPLIKQHLVATLQLQTNDFIQFNFSTAGLSGVKLKLDYFANAPIPGALIQYSTDGATFTNAGSILGTQNFTTFNFDLSSVTALNNLSTAYIRLTLDNVSNSNSAQLRLDNIEISAVPEPTTGLLIGVGTLACAAFRRNRRVA